LCYILFLSSKTNRPSQPHKTITKKEKSIGQLDKFTRTIQSITKNHDEFPEMVNLNCIINMVDPTVLFILPTVYYYDDYSVEKVCL